MKIAMRKAGLTSYGLGKELSLSPSGIDGWRVGRTAPGEYSCRVLFKKFPDLAKVPVVRVEPGRPRGRGAAAGPKARPEEKLGAALRRVRKREGLSASALAAELGMKTATLYQWETGARSPRTEDHHMLCQRFPELVEAPWEEKKFLSHARTLPPENPNVFGVALKREREKAKLSARVVAMGMGLTAPTVYFWEKGGSSPSSENLRDLRERFPALATVPCTPGRGGRAMSDRAEAGEGEGRAAEPVAPARSGQAVEARESTSGDAFAFWSALKKVDRLEGRAAFVALLKGAERSGVTAGELLGLLDV